MYSSQSFDEKVTGSKRNEDYDLCNTETRKKFLTNISPQYCARYLSKNRYASPRSVSKSVPRRKRGIVRYNFNRSLNFDVGARRSDSFKSPNSSSDSNVPIESDQYLSRSAKILRALNINCSPLQGTKLGGRKINKSLNFDLSPSPKRLTPFGKSSRNHSLKTYPSPLSKINKTLNFDTSSNDSNVNSVLNSSVESIDENQNQTPSQRNRSAKKSLNYLSPSSEKSFGSSDSDVHSPMLRSGLKTKIEKIVLTSMTPNMQSPKRILVQSKFDNFGASTPRNLYNDFDDNDNDVNDRPQTPENVIKIIPESMSAIKKSHKKERVLGRIGKAVAHQAESYSGIEAFTDIELNTPREESRPITPLITIDQYPSPQCAVNSIKQSHKKDKSKRKSFVYRSEDEMSDTGSIFDYTDVANMVPDTDSLSSADNSDPNSELPKIRVSEPSEEDNEFKAEEKSPADDKSEREANDSLGEDAAREVVGVDMFSTPSCSFSSPEPLSDADCLKMQEESTKQVTNLPSPQSSDNTAKTPPRNSTNGNTLRPVTPENRINFLQRIMTNSIKKSHKKTKDSNKKSLFKPSTIHNDPDEDKKNEHVGSEDLRSPEEGDRAGTPENMNSSRLLLSQFSSVKKSHRKDKHRRMITGSIQRKKFMSREYDEPSNSDGEDHNCSVFSSNSDLPNLSPSRISPGNAKRRKSDANDFSSDNSSDAHYQTFERSTRKDDVFETGIGALPGSEPPKSSPNKRKNHLDVSAISGSSQSSSNLGSISMEYESAEEEFKIFTPIKKRKSLGTVAPTARRICENNDPSPEKAKAMDEAFAENSASRCCTPTTARSNSLKLVENTFKTPERNASGVLLTIPDHSSPVIQEVDNVDDPSGRSTPQNSSTSVLMAGINSIKKSHKKDKRGNISRRSLICAQEEEYESEATSNLEKDLLKSSSQSHGSPQPSTSYGSATERDIGESENEINSQTKTPPNCLKVKTYLRLMQTASIKRSHKKVRDRKKFKSVTVDPELSNDGSIFDEAEKSLAMENESLKVLEEQKENDGSSTGSLKIEGDQNFQKRKGQYYHQDEAPVHYSGNLSDDGSIFDTEEKLESPSKIGNSDEQEGSQSNSIE